MRYVEGRDLGQFLREDPPGPERAIAICSQVADALDAAHERGLVHRDVKPSNVLLDSHEHVYLADFGLTRRLADPKRLTVEARSLGTVDYVAPEQIRGEEVDGRADIYSLGCLLYECLTGGPPFPRVSDAAVLFAHLEEDATLPAWPGGGDAQGARQVARGSLPERTRAGGRGALGARDCRALPQPLAARSRRDRCCADRGCLARGVPHAWRRGRSHNRGSSHGDRPGHQQGEGDGSGGSRGERGRGGRGANLGNDARGRRLVANRPQDAGRAADRGERQPGGGRDQRRDGVRRRRQRPLRT